MARNETPWGLAKKVDTTVEKALDAIDRFNDASDVDASEKQLQRLDDRANELMEKAADMHQELLDLVQDYWSEYEWLR